jgi:hypothetical protein
MVTLMMPFSKPFGLFGDYPFDSRQSLLERDAPSIHLCTTRACPNYFISRKQKLPTHSQRSDGMPYPTNNVYVLHEKQLTHMRTNVSKLFASIYNVPLKIVIYVQIEKN